MRPFAERLREERLGSHMSQKDLAERSGVSPRSIQEYEYDNSVPTIYAAAKIADALEVSLDWLAGM